MRGSFLLTSKAPHPVSRYPMYTGVHGVSTHSSAFEVNSKCPCIEMQFRCTPVRHGTQERDTYKVDHEGEAVTSKCLFPVHHA